ncbi:type II toxin-antitoxin system RelE/ParE family toxin [Salmonella enterica subsp. enterica serovar Montevideo]|uniref:Type II toxin-antitoxin system RelE/ParE family toxin n=2 Tax=Salmonella enterica TaxID=28901 RepID=A0A3Z6QNP2_SALEB|nr:type II toxin-antitoxin system RelE/ParE family toxin [Salmonella enterica]EAB6034469.1 type II toxin-antitoxin system RelE/ParE family toxin [Salmonella enterica subsp. enterica serovar Java]EBS1128255.1 type II toxin-antitoxin system RelE/ParE family toxin [Salmonella enterica subsp. enterica serovar Montevideo]EBV8394820.1 type II toxin-antitoxin system RelE/ParE family toxin [Salmonella enterica subsp. enterica serovar Virchow]EBW9897297.1 type II toxin-antitoxin system RelE/ParE family 
MEIKWTRRALSDVSRLYDFLSRVNRQAAARTVKKLTQAPLSLHSNPRIGEQLFQFSPDEVRRIFIGDYEIRYQIQSSVIYILRLWHTRENR